MATNYGAQDGSAFPLLVKTVELEDDEGGGASAAVASEAGAGLDRLVTGTLRQVLGWSPNQQDTKGFTGALEQSFDLKKVEGHVAWTWKARSFAVITDLEGGVTGAQASVYTRAKDALDHALPLLDGLYPLTLDADPEDSLAIKALIREHLMSLVGELGRLGGPRVARVDQLFCLLLGRALQRGPADAFDESSEIRGELGRLRAELGLSGSDDLVNTVAEEQNQTNYRILADYVIGLRLAWTSNRAFFARACDSKPFFGTQLVHISRLLAVIAESLREVRFAFGTVMIGPREREVLEVHPRSPSRRSEGEPADECDTLRWDDLYAALEAAEPASHDARDPMYLEELLSWIETFAREEGPRLVRDGGKVGVQEAFRPTVSELKSLVNGIRCPDNLEQLPAGYRTERVQNALFELEKQFGALLQVIKPIKHETLPVAGGPAPPTGGTVAATARPTSQAQTKQAKQTAASETGK